MMLADIELENGNKIDVERVLRLALLHDLSETLTFDISKSYLEYLGRRGETIKNELDQSASKHLLKGIRNNAIRSNYARLHSEFNAERTMESKIVHAADRLDILLQVVEYCRKGYPEAILADLWSSTNQKLGGTKLLSVKQLHKMTLRLYKATIS
jgi:putative hydrolase of HD superfamily